MSLPVMTDPAASPDAAPARRLDAVREWAVGTLAAAGVPNPEVDAELLVGHVLGISRGQVQARSIGGSELGLEDYLAVATAVERRAAREPLQHITGRAPHPPTKVGPEHTTGLMAMMSCLGRATLALSSAHTASTISTLSTSVYETG